MRWSDGPKNFGCVYHQRGVCKHAGDSILADVFIMPRIASRRPIAVTIGRYRDYKPVSKREWQLRDPSTAAKFRAKVSSLFEEVGASTTIAQQLGAEVCAFLVQQSSTLKAVLESVSSSAPSRTEPDSDDLPP